MLTELKRMQEILDKQMNGASAGGGGGPPPAAPVAARNECPREPQVLHALYGTDPHVEEERGHDAREPRGWDGADADGGFRPADEVSRRGRHCVGSYSHVLDLLLSASDKISPM